MKASYNKENDEERYVTIPGHFESRKKSNILNKSYDKEVPKAHIINNEEDDKLYTLIFEKAGKRIKIFLSEKDVFPAMTYEEYYSYEDFINKNEWFNQFKDNKEIIIELNETNNNESFTIKKKENNPMTIFINFPAETGIPSTEFILKENEIDNREMFRQLFVKFKSIQQEHEEDVSNFTNRIKYLEEIMEKINGNNNKEEKSENNYQNEEQEENKKEDEKSEVSKSKASKRTESKLAESKKNGEKKEEQKNIKKENSKKLSNKKDSKNLSKNATTNKKNNVKGTKEQPKTKTKTKEIAKPNFDLHKKK